MDLWTDSGWTGTSTWPSCHAWMKWIFWHKTEALKISVESELYFKLHAQRIFWTCTLLHLNEDVVELNSVALTKICSKTTKATAQIFFCFSLWTARHKGRRHATSAFCAGSCSAWKDDAKIHLDETTNSRYICSSSVCLLAELICCHWIQKLYVRGYIWLDRCMKNKSLIL